MNLISKCLIKGKMQKCHINTCLIVLSIILLNLSQYVEGGMHQKKLIRKIFNNYDASERPVANENKNMDVNVGLSIQQIVDIVLSLFKYKDKFQFTCY